MLEIEIPGYGALHLAHAVLDYNGTVAIDGKLLPAVRKRLRALAQALAVHVVTADTFGRARAELTGLPCALKILGSSAQDRAKAAYVRRLGASRTVAIGNGRNDRLMLRAAALGIAIIQAEGASTATLGAADIVVPSAIDALDLLLRPKRIVASLRS